MIDRIQIRNIALIREADIGFSEGLTVITGETGSGKTALLSSLKLLMGERSDKDAIREGCQDAQVTGRFFLSEDDEDGTLVQRTVSRDGRSRVSVNGEMATVKALSEGVGQAVDLCGQHENQRLLASSVQLALLDAWCGSEVKGPKTAYDAAFAQRREAAKELARIKDLESADKEQIENARFVLRCIDEVSPAEGEYEELLLQSRLQENAELIARCSHTVSECLMGDRGATTLLSEAISALSELAKVDASYGGFAEALQEGLYAAEDVAREVSSRTDEGGFDPERFEELQERISAFQGLMRTYGPTMQEVFAARDAAREVLAVAQDSSEAIQAAQAALKKADEALLKEGRALLKVRQDASGSFAAAVGQVMARLEMGDSALECQVEELPFEKWGPEGPCQVEFMYRPGADMGLRPLRKIASGGELSRVMLAVKAALGKRDAGGTLVFDEIDAGVGGKTALSLAEVLQELSRTHQVIVVTHLPQVAVAGDAHLVVAKEGDETVVQQVEGDARQQEVARMLAGSVNETSLHHAAELLGSC